MPDSVANNYAMPSEAMPVIDILVGSGAVSSKREAVRLLDAGAIEFLNWVATKAPGEQWAGLRLAMAPRSPSCTIRVGKHKWVRVLPYQPGSAERTRHGR